MVLYIGLMVVTVALSYFVNNRTAAQLNSVSRQQMVNRLCMTCIFLLLFLVSACRINVGNDYGEYLEIFQDIHKGNHVSTEPGFNAVVLAVQFLFGTGQVSALIIFGIFAFATVYFMLKAMYDQSEWFVYTFFLFMAQGLYFSSMTTVRYYFVLSIALYSMKYAMQKRWLPFLLWIVFAAFFHKSVLFVLPVYFIASMRWKKWHILLGGGLCVTFVLFREQYRRLIFLFYPFYENSPFDNGETSLMSIVKCAGGLALAFLYYKYAIKDKRENSFYFHLNLMALLLYVFGSFMPEISRICYYLSVSNIILVPSVLKSIPKKKQKLFFGTVVAICFLLYFLLYLRGADDVAIRLLPYKSWLFL